MPACKRSSRVVVATVLAALAALAPPGARAGTRRWSLRVEHCVTHEPDWTVTGALGHGLSPECGTVAPAMRATRAPVRWSFVARLPEVGAFGRTAALAVAVAWGAIEEAAPSSDGAAAVRWAFAACMDVEVREDGPGPETRQPSGAVAPDRSKPMPSASNARHRRPAPPPPKLVDASHHPGPKNASSHASIRPVAIRHASRPPPHASPPPAPPMSASTAGPRPEHMLVPDYPHTARRRSEEGVVVVRCRVSASGEPRDVRVISSSGSALLDATASRALSGSRLAPRPAETFREVSYRFVLR